MGQISMRIFRIDLKSAARIAISLALILALIYISDPKATVSAILTASPYYLVLAVILKSLVMLIYTLRWMSILHTMGHRLSMAVVHQALMASAFISDFTPARAGDLTRPLFINDDVRMSRGLASIIIDHWAELITASLLGLLGVLIIVPPWGRYNIAILVYLLGVAGMLSLVLFRGNLVRDLSGRTGLKWIIDATESFYSVLEGIKDVPRMLVTAMAITMVVWLIHALRIVAIGKALGYEVPVIPLIFLLPIVNFIAAVPITLSGLGLLEGGITAVMVMMGLPTTQGLSIALIDRAMSVAYHALVGSRYASRLIYAKMGND